MEINERYSRYRTPLLYAAWKKMITKADTQPDRFSIDPTWRESLQAFGDWRAERLQILNKDPNIDYMVTPNLYQWNNPHKHYGPMACSVVPREIEMALSKSQYMRENPTYPPGVKKGASANAGYYGDVNYTIDGKKVRNSYGPFTTPAIAFIAYKMKKEEQFHVLADRFFSIGALLEADYYQLISLTVVSDIMVDEINQLLASNKPDEVERFINSKAILPLKIFDYSKFYVGTCYRHNRTGSWMRIIRYEGRFNVDVEFLDDTHYIAKNLIIDNVKNGNVHNPYWRLNNGGYYGEGPYDTGKDLHVYKMWDGILFRAYIHREDPHYNAYKNCSLDEIWLNYQEFAKWYYEQLSKVNPDDNLIHYEADKDLLQWGNEYKIYSPSTCCLLPHDINLAISGIYIAESFAYNRTRELNLPWNQADLVRCHSRKEYCVHLLADYYYSLGAITDEIYNRLYNIII